MDGGHCLTVPLCEGRKPSKSHALPCVARNGMGGEVAETSPDLRTAEHPEGEKLQSVAEMKEARLGGLEGLLARPAESVQTLRVGFRGIWQTP